MQTNENASDEDDDAFLRRLIVPEEDRQRLFPKTRWTGGYRWFRSHNVVCLERYRSSAERTRVCANLLGGRR
jgi:hypothetical protein